MCPTTRREVLRSAGIVLAGGLAGCGFLGGSRAPRLGTLVARNFDPRPHDVHVLVIEDGDAVYWDTERVGPGSAETGTSVAFTGLPSDRAAYRVLARLDDQPRSAASTIDLGEFDADCLALRVYVEPDENAGPVRPTIYHSTDPDACGTSENER